MSVYRIYVEKKPAFAQEAAALLSDIRTLLQITSLEELRLLNRYDVEGIDEALFDSCRSTVFSEPQLDNTYSQLPAWDGPIFAVEYLPGQFDQRADSCAQCIQIGFPRRATHGSYRPGLSPQRKPDPGAAGRYQKTRHQPGGKPGGLSGDSGDPEHSL